MKKALLFLLLGFAATVQAEPTRAIFNPYTGKQDFITKLTSTTLPSGSTSYIQNSSTLQSGATFYVSSGTVQGQFTAAAASANTKPIVVRADALQSVNLQEWQNGSGVPIGYVAPDGGGSFLGQYMNIGNSSVGGRIQEGYHTESGIWLRFADGDTYIDAGNTMHFRVNGEGTLHNVLDIASTGASLFTTPTANVTPLSVKAAASQSANLQEWQDSSGNKLAYFGPSGNLTINQLNAAFSWTATNNPGIVGWTSLGSGNAVRFSIGGDSNVLQSSFGGRTVLNSYWGIEMGGNRQASSGSSSFTSGGASDPSVSVLGTQTGAVVMAVKGAASQSANLQEWQNSSGSPLAQVDSAGNVSIGTTTHNQRLTVQGSTTSTAGMIVSAGINGFALGLGANSSNPFLQGYTDVLGSAAKDLVLQISGGKVGINKTSPGAQLHIQTDSASNIGQIVQGAASQSADLQEWQDSSGNTISSVDKNGVIAPYSRTLAQLQALAPSKAGLIYYCSDCTTDGIVLSTGTVAGSFGRISARTTAIQ